MVKSPIYREYASVRKVQFYVWNSYEGLLLWHYCILMQKYVIITTKTIVKVATSMSSEHFSSAKGACLLRLHTNFDFEVVECFCFHTEKWDQNTANLSPSCSTLTVSGFFLLSFPRAGGKLDKEFGEMSHKHVCQNKDTNMKGFIAWTEELLRCSFVLINVMKVTPKVTLPFYNPTSFWPAEELANGSGPTFINSGTLHSIIISSSTIVVAAVVVVELWVIYLSCNFPQFSTRCLNSN